MDISKITTNSVDYLQKISNKAQQKAVSFTSE